MKFKRASLLPTGLLEDMTNVRQLMDYTNNDIRDMLSGKGNAANRGVDPDPGASVGFEAGRLSDDEVSAILAIARRAEERRRRRRAARF